MINRRLAIFASAPLLSVLLAACGVGADSSLAQSPEEADVATATTDPVLQGAIDIHAHLDPDGYGPGGHGRSMDALDLAELAEQAGMRGFVIKQHYDQTADTAYFVRKLYPDLDVFGGIGTNFATGGLNPYAIRQMADVKGGWGRVVWMPTWDARHYVVNHGNDRPFITVASDGELTPEVSAVIEAMAEVSGRTRVSGGSLVLATGHNAPEEVLLMVEKARALGLQVIVTHPLLDSVGMSVEQMKQAAELGAYLEFVSAFTRQPETIVEYADAIREVGVEYCIVSSDRGQGSGPEGDEARAQTHVEALTAAADALRANGFTEQDLDIMFKENPARLLGLPVLQ